MIDENLQRKVTELAGELTRLGQELGSTCGAELTKLAQELASAYADRSPQASLVLWGATSVASWVPGLSLISAATTVLQHLEADRIHAENKQLKEDVARLRQDVAELRLLIRG